MPEDIITGEVVIANVGNRLTGKIAISIYCDVITERIKLYFVYTSVELVCDGKKPSFIITRNG